MRYLLGILAVVVVIVGGFAALPTDKVYAYRAPPHPYDWTRDKQEPLQVKSGLRMAIEGRLKWLGIEVSDPSPSHG